MVKISENLQIDFPSEDVKKFIILYLVGFFFVYESSRVSTG